MQTLTGGITQKIVLENNIELYTNIADRIDNIMIAYWGRRILFSDDVDETILVATANIYDNLYKWDKIIGTTKLTYNPIQNYDSEETETTNFDRAENNNKNEKIVSGKQHGLDTTTYTPNLVTKTEGGDTTQTSPYNNDNFYNANKTSTDVSVKDTGTSTNTVDKTSDEHTDVSDITDNNNINDLTVRHLVRSGNIGVTSSQQMITQERDIADLHVIRDIAHEIVNAISSAVYCY